MRTCHVDAAVVLTPTGSMRMMQDMQAELNNVRAQRNKLEVQRHENELVLQELELASEPEANVYKMVGPLLVKQDMAEAKSNVQKRIDFIKSELTRLEDKSKASEAKLREQNERLMKLQQKVSAEQQARMQQAAQQAAAAHGKQ